MKFILMWNRPKTALPYAFKESPYKREEEKKHQHKSQVKRMSERMNINSSNEWKVQKKYITKMNSILRHKKRTICPHLKKIAFSPVDVKPSRATLPLVTLGSPFHGLGLEMKIISHRIFMENFSIFTSKCCWLWRWLWLSTRLFCHIAGFHDILTCSLALFLPVSASANKIWSISPKKRGDLQAKSMDYN